MKKTLPVRLSNTEIGTLYSGGSFRWAEHWEAIAPLNSPVLSRSIPFGVTKADPAPFFGGLLPEGIGLGRLAREARVPSNDLFALLSEVGADVGGSVTIGEPHPPVPLDAPTLDEVLNRAAGYLRGTHTGGGGSAATGVQPKVALTLNEEQDLWMIGQGSIPSTHILKPVHKDAGVLIHAEAFMNSVARKLRLAHFSVEVRHGNERDVLIIERYDRYKDSDGSVQRLHQEDAAQALGLPWGGNDKYENVNPRASLKNIAELLPPHTVLSARESDRSKLLQLTVLNIVAGNTDAHAKNFAFMMPSLDDAFTRSGRDVRLADAYDIVPQQWLSAEPQSLSMRISGKSIQSSITAEDLIHEGRSWGLPHAHEVVHATLTNIIDAVGSTCAESGGFRSLPEYLIEQAENLLKGDQAWTRRVPAAIAFLRSKK